ncbi:MAG: hypothetical protein WBA97_34525 [Actinophytocola sp.]|uniref:hypothetical protein n=1 Tax=Actinophytocola sp. TaxID=1872138 RepID=UPI003C730E7A
MRRTILPTHPFLRHPHTGAPLQAVGVVNGKPVWPILGGSEPGGEPTPPAPVPTPPPAPAPTPPNEPLGEPGKAALEAERKARKEAEKAAKDFEARLKAIEDKDKSELEKATARLAELEQNYGTERATRLRLEIASEFEIGKDDLVLLTATDEDGLRAQAERVKARNDAAAGRPPAPLPGQGTPPAAPKTGSVSAGADEYRRKNQKAT